VTGETGFPALSGASRSMGLFFSAPAGAGPVFPLL
jgi:hypothetical protein